MSRKLTSASLPLIAASLLFTASVQAQIPGIGPVGEIARAQTGFQFTEGPAADLQGNIYFSDVQRNRIHKLDTQGALTTFLEDTQGINGLMFDQRGRLIACQSGAGRIVAIDIVTKNTEVIADKFNNVRFNSPNDLVVDRQGGIYFSDPSFGGTPTQDRQAVYYIAPGGSVTRLIDNLTRPNGLILSLDEKTLYVLHGSNSVMVYPVNSPGRLGAPQTFALQGNGGGDGMTIDTQGNLYVTRPNINAIQVLKPNGESLGTITFQEAPSNCAFGGPDLKTLYVTARTSVYTAKMLSIGYRFASHITSVSAACYRGDPLARSTITALFGSGLATATQAAMALPLPTSLAGASVKITDSAGVEQNAPLFYVSPLQINYQLPENVAVGGATITVTTGAGNVFTGPIRIVNAAPCLFAANGNGQGVAAAVVLRVRNGVQTFEPVAKFDPSLNMFVATPIDLGPETDIVFLLLYGSGFSFYGSLSNVSLTIGGANVEVSGIGTPGGFVGLDQVNARLPRSLIGRGEVDVVLMVDGIESNTMTVNIK
jgi:gluconolactonase